MKIRPLVKLLRRPRRHDSRANLPIRKQNESGIPGWSDQIYLAMYPDVLDYIIAGKISSAQDHFAQSRPPYDPANVPKYPEGWDDAGYLILHPDVAAMVSIGAIANGYHHYSVTGRTERRCLPTPSDWSEDFYLELYPPIRQAVNENYFTSGYEHYLFHGRLEGRRILREQPADWDEEGYLRFNQDVLDAVQNKTMPSGWYHYELYGRGERRSPGLPTGLISSLKDIAELEPELFPSTTFLRGLTRYEAVRPSTAGEIYYDFFAATDGKSYTHVILAPWIKTGGSDKVTLLHLDYLAAQPGASVLLILTENTDSPWISRVKNKITIFQFDDRLRSLTAVEQKHLLFRMLSTSRATTLHVVNSAIGWRLLAENGIALRSQFKIFVSLFAFGYSPEGEMVGYARMAPDVWPFIDYFVTDNNFIISQIRKIFAVPAQRFFPIPYPAELNIRFTWTGKSRRILWASRFDREKRPDILYEIAKRLPDVVFDIFGDITIGNSSDTKVLVDKFKALHNVNLLGRFDGFASIPTADYAFFLYTSESDGLPNVLLEAQGSGLPTLAPNVGGVSEVVLPFSGFLINQFSDVEEYVRRIIKLLPDTEAVAKERNLAIDRIRNERNLDAFHSRLQDLPNYL